MSYVSIGDNPTPEQLRNRKRWARHLRSGKYKQGRGALCPRVNETGAKWCCLGVAADRFLDGTWVPIVDNRGGKGLPLWELHYVDYWSGLSRSIGALPPHVVTRLFGIDADSRDALIDANDKGVRFTTIAGWLEAGQIPQKYYH